MPYDTLKASDLRTLTPVLTLQVPLWIETHDYQPGAMRSPKRHITVPVVLWPDLDVKGTVVREHGYATTETFIVLQEWDEQVLLHELLHVVLGHILLTGDDPEGRHDVIGAVEVALAPFVTFGRRGATRLGEVGLSAPSSEPPAWPRLLNDPSHRPGA